MSVSPITAREAVEGFNVRINDMETESYVAAMGIEISLIAKEYGGREMLTSQMIKESVDFIEEMFGHFGLHEVRTAYKLWAAGRLKADEMWGGVFNVKQLGSVLSGYEKVRKQIINAYRDEKDNQKLIEPTSREQLSAQEVEDLLTHYREKAKSWSEAPYFLWRASWIVCGYRLTDEQKDWIERKATAEVERWANVAKMNVTGSQYSAKSKREAIESRVLDRRAIIAGQVALYYCILFPELYEKEING